MSIDDAYGYVGKFKMLAKYKNKDTLQTTNVNSKIYVVVLDGDSLANVKEVDCTCNKRER